MQCGSETESMMIRKYPFISHSIHFRLLIQFSIATMFLFSSAINGNLSLTYVREFNLGTTCAKKIQKLTNCGKTPEVLLTYVLKFYRVKYYEKVFQKNFQSCLKIHNPCMKVNKKSRVKALKN